LRAEVPANLVSATILPGWRTDDGGHMAALRLTLAPGWKTYWRAPGEAGIPPAFEWAGSVNVAGVQLHWPRPDVFLTNGMQTIGYHDELVLPIEITSQAPGKPIHLVVQVELGVCQDICVPATVNVAVDLPAKGGADPVISQALNDQPRPAKEAGLSGLSCDVTPIADGLRVTARMEMPLMGPVETVVLESQQPGVWVSESATVRSGGDLLATADLVGDSGAPFVLERDRMLLTVLSGNRAVQVQGCPSG
jgi:DsbC/DsbD-like thiol-disulfide interchange protein